ncbi:MAG TPA: PadR family transcriptional regulator [Vicinamibacterales bacterium]|jgi:transcriptional regulator|nr:PadR family transcriptional regulator [Vicinamibacterales bacterium]
MPPRKDVPSGTLDLLILRLVARGPMHGWGLMKRLSELTDDVFQATPGAVFPALQRIEESGWVTGEWGVSENNRKARFYTITKAGRRQLEKEREHWNAITAAVSRVLEGA